MLAVDGEHDEAAKLLVGAGADVNLANNAGCAAVGSGRVW